MLQNNSHVGLLPVLAPVGVEDIKTTNTAAYAAVLANISALLAFVKTLTLIAKRTMNVPMTPSCAFSSFRSLNTTIAPNRRMAAVTVLTIAATQVTWLSLIYSVSSVSCVVFDGQNIEAQGYS